MKNLLNKYRAAAAAASAVDQRPEAAEPPTLFAAEDLREIERAEALKAERRAALENRKRGRKK